MQIDASVLKRKRIERVLSVRELAKMAGINHDAILQIERGERQPQPRTIRKLAAALDVAPAALLLREALSPEELRPHGTDDEAVSCECHDNAFS